MTTDHDAIYCQRMHVLQETIASQTAKSQSDASETDSSHKRKANNTDDDKRCKRKQNERDTPKRKIDSKRRKLNRSIILTEEEGSKQLNAVVGSDS